MVFCVRMEPWREALECYYQGKLSHAQRYRVKKNRVYSTRMSCCSRDTKFQTFIKWKQANANISKSSHTIDLLLHFLGSGIMGNIQLSGSVLSLPLVRPMLPPSSCIFHIASHSCNNIMQCNIITFNAIIL